MTAQAGDTALLKQQLRREFRRRRAALPADERRRAAREAARRLARTPLFRRARRIALYLAYGSELDTAPLRRLCAQRRKTVYMPRIGRRGHMAFVELAPCGRLRPNRHGIREPLQRPGAGRPALDLVMLPLTAFDAQGHRLGTGGGYYDRAFARHRGRRPLLVGYAYAAQEAGALPRDPWDLRLDAVVTERFFRPFRS
jgi:5-formyltetrahydrofolate cyclo-ligase